jgi:ParB family chromosome partitioning protein
MSLMAFCTACSVDGVQTRECGHTRRSDLDGVEAAPGSICATGGSRQRITSSGAQQGPDCGGALKEAGLTGAASDAEKMKRVMPPAMLNSGSPAPWVPGWMQSPDAAKPDDAHAAPDTDEPTSHAA